MPSAVFISVTALPFFSVTVGEPVASDPPAMPIFADVEVNETSRKNGESAGKSALTMTAILTPLTEIVAIVGGGAAGVGGGRRSSSRRTSSA